MKNSPQKFNKTWIVFLFGLVIIILLAGGIYLVVNFKDSSNEVENNTNKISNNINTEFIENLT